MVDDIFFERQFFSQCLSAQQKNMSKRKRLVLDQIAFDISYPCTKHQQNFDLYNCNGATVANGDDLFHMRIEFVPPLSKAQGNASSVRVTYLPARKSYMRLVILPSTERKSTERIGTMGFIVFETHAIELDKDTGQLKCMWLSLENRQTRGPKKHSLEEPCPILEPVIDPVYFMHAQFDTSRYVGLPFFPPGNQFDTQTLRTLSIDASKIPQRIPLWWKVCGSVTGSQLTELVGIYVPNIDAEPAMPADTADGERMSAWKKDLVKWQHSIEDWEIKRPKVFTGWSAVNVRKGRMAEDKIVLCYLHQYASRSFHECGYFPHPDNPSSWGASPDGIVYDSGVTSRALKRDAPWIFRDFNPEHFDLTRGVVEFKATSFDCTFKSYYVVQAIWEMQSANTLWCDIVRYSSGQWKLNPKTQRYMRTGQRCRTYRLFRRKKADELLQECVRQAVAARQKGDKMAYLRLMQTKPFIKFRAYCDKVVEKCNASADEMTVPVALFASYDEFRQTCCDNTAQIDAHMPSLHPAIERIEDRQYQLFQLYGDQSQERQVMSLANQQIADYAQLIESLFTRDT